MGVGSFGMGVVTFGKFTFGFSPVSKGKKGNKYKFPKLPISSHFHTFLDLGFSP